VTAANQVTQDAVDYATESFLQLIRAENAHRVKYRHAIGDALDPIEQDEMEMKVEIGRSAEAPD